MKQFRSLALAGVLSLAACDKPERAAEALPPIPGEAYANLPPGTDSIVLDRVGRIGQLDGAPKYALGEVFSAIARDDNSVYVCDRNDTSIREYDARGTFVRAVGRRGAGPGEYQNCLFLSLVGDTVLWVGDTPNGRFVGFRTDGGDAGVLVGGEYSNPMFVDERGRFWWQRIAVDRGAGMDRQEFRVTDREMRELEVVRIPPRLFGRLHPRAFTVPGFEGNYHNVYNDSVWSVTPSGALLKAAPSAYHVLRGGGGRPAIALERDVEPVGYEPAEREQWERWREYFERELPRISGGAPIKYAALSESKPVIRSVRGDELDRTWVQVSVRAEEVDGPTPPPGSRRPQFTWRERNTYDLFDASGSFIGRVSLPHRTLLLTSRGDRVWLLEEGESGEHLIGIYVMKPARR